MTGCESLLVTTGTPDLTCQPCHRSQSCQDWPDDHSSLWKVYWVWQVFYLLMMVFYWSQEFQVFCFYQVYQGCGLMLSLIYLKLSLTCHVLEPGSGAWSSGVLVFCDWLHDGCGSDHSAPSQSKLVLTTVTTGVNL